MLLLKPIGVKPMVLPPLRALCQRTPRGLCRGQGRREAALESRTHRRADQPPEDAEAPAVWPSPARPAGPTVPPGGMTRHGSSTTPGPRRPSHRFFDRHHQKRPRAIKRPNPWRRFADTPPSEVSTDHLYGFRRFNWESDRRESIAVPSGPGAATAFGDIGAYTIPFARPPTPHR